jgi:CheY-like chemotaxis protein
MSKKVLMVDDEPDIIALTKMILEKNGFEVSTASDGKEGLQRAAVDKPDLIILDIRMPKICGEEVAAELGRDPHTAYIPIIFFTNSTTVSSLTAELEETGVFHKGAHKAILSKSCSNEELLSTIAKLLKV